LGASYSSQVGPGIIHSMFDPATITKCVTNVFSSLWLQKAVVLILLQRLLSGIKYTKGIIKVYWAILGVSYTTVQIATFTDCKPFKLWWQVVPDPGKF
jgi:hypothetical protein